MRAGLFVLLLYVNACAQVDYMASVYFPTKCLLFLEWNILTRIYVDQFGTRSLEKTQPFYENY